jgi:hypothetical protein
MKKITTSTSFVTKSQHHTLSIKIIFSFLAGKYAFNKKNLAKKEIDT